MSLDLEHQIGNLFDEIQGGQTPVTVNEIMARRLGSEPVRPIAPLAQPATPRPRWLVAVAAAVAVLVLVGGLALLLRVIGSGAPVATTTPTVDLSSLRWSPVTQTEAVFGGAGAQSMMSVTAGGPGLVAVGSDSSERRDQAAVWTSVDGVTWARVGSVEPTSGGDRHMASVTAGGPGLVAVGSGVWTSIDGITWTRRDAGLYSHGPSVLTGEDWQSMTSVTAGGPGLVAVGINWSDADGGAAVWTSVDGITWTRVPHDEAIFGSSIMTSVTVGGPGLVAVGIDWSNPDGDAAVWTSVDGITWTRVPNSESVFGGAGFQRMMSVTAGGPGLVAGGSEEFGEDRHAAVWTSVDGVVWSRVPHDEAVFGGPGETMASVTAAGAGLVAVGPNDTGSASWTSFDGTTWSRVPIDGTGIGAMSSVSVGGPGLVAVGSTDDDREDAAVWIGEDQ